MDYITVIIILGSFTGYEILKFAIQKLFKNGSKDRIMYLENKINELPEKYVLYERYKADLEEIKRKLDELVKLYYE